MSGTAAGGATAAPIPLVSSLAEDIAGYIQGTPQTAATLAVDYWHLVNWQQEAMRLQAALTALVALRAVAAAAEAYALACDAVQAVYGSASADWGARMGEAMHARQEASDALCAAVAARQPVAPDPPGAARAAAGDKARAS